MRRARLTIPQDDISIEIIPKRELVFDFNTNRLVIGDGLNIGQNLPELNPFFSSNVLTTTDDTPTTIETISLPDNSAGIIELRMSCASQSGVDALVGVKNYLYQKVGEVLTISSAVDIMADTKINFSTAPTWQGVNSSDVFNVDVTGVAATDIGWRLHYKVVFVPFTYVAP